MSLTTAFNAHLPSIFYLRGLPAILAAHLMLLESGSAQSTNAPPPAASAPISSETKTSREDAAAAKQAELIQKLQERIDQLEQKEAERRSNSAASEQQHEEREQKLLKRIGELESKVGSLESGRAQPEVSSPAKEGQTLQDLDQKIRIVERKNEIATEETQTRLKELPKLTVGQEGFGIASANGDFALRVRGHLQLDYRNFFDDNPLLRGNDSFLVRRARPILEGTVFRDFDFLFVPDFGGSSPLIFDAYVNYRLLPELQFRVGKFKGPVGLEQLQSDAFLLFNERALPTALVPTRNVGVELWGEIGGGIGSYAVGFFNGAGDARNPGNSDFDDDKEFAGRILFQPFLKTDLAPLKGFAFGLGGSYSEVHSNALGLPNTTGGTLPGYATDGQQQFFAYNPTSGTVVANGAHWRLSPQAYYTYGPFGLLGEYTISHQQVYNSATAQTAGLEHTAWQIQGQWVLTGEPASFSGINPKHPFTLHEGGGWGAWQLVARCSQLNIDDAAFQGFSNPATSAHRATEWAVGINWWLNRNIRILTSFSHTKFDGGGAFNPAQPATLNPPATVTHQDENVLFTRFQLAF